MKSSFLSILVLLTAATSFAGMTFDDIDTWVGSGSNQVALVIDWNDGGSELVKVWGFRWDGPATSADMLLAVCAADSDLYAMGYMGTFGGFGYNTDGDSNFDIANGILTGTFIDGYMEVASWDDYDDWVATDTGDNWSSGWNTAGFWGYYGYENGIWAYPGAGASSRILQNGTCDGWSWSPSFAMSDPSVAVVPEPVTLMLLGAGVCLVRKRK